MFNFYLPITKNIKGNKSFFFLLLLIIATPSFITAQWELANGPYEAALNNISFDAQNPNIIYTTGDGVFRSKNSGESWVTIEPDTTLGSNTEPVIEADPNHTGTVYYGGHGALFKSTNYGDNWMTLGFENRSVSSIEIDPFNSEVIYVGLKRSSDDAIWKSTDGGTTWEKKTTGIPVSTYPFQNCRSIKVNPLNPNSLYAAINSEGIFKSIDGGNNWTFLLSLNTQEIEILGWDTTIVLAAIGGGIKKSTDAGLTWKSISNESANCLEIDSNSKAIYAGTNRSTDEGNTWISLGISVLPESLPLPMGIYDIKIDPTNNNILYLATYAGIYKSFNKGGTWQQSFDGLNRFYVFNLAISPSNHSIIYATGRGGIHKSTDGGLTWIFLREVSAATNITIDPTNSEIVFLEDATPLLESYLLKTTDGGKNWETKLFTCTSFGFIKFDPQNSSILYTKTEENGLMKSSDRGETWEKLNAPPRPYSFLISKEKNGVFYISSFNGGIYKTTDAGLTWDSLRLAFGSHNRSLLYFAPENENVIYASVYGRGVFKTMDGGTSWEEKNNGLADTIIGGIFPDPKQLGRLFLVSLSGLYVSTNNGDDWNKFRSEELAGIYYPLCIDTAGSGKIYAIRNNENGIYILDSIYSNPSFVEENSLPQNFILYQNYPNPFNPTTTIHYRLPQSGKVTLKLFDILGNEVKTLVNEQKEMGNYSVQFSSGDALASGMYIYQLHVNDYVSAKKMLLLK